MVGNRNFMLLMLSLLTFFLNNCVTLNTSHEEIVNKSRLVAANLATSLDKALDFLNKYYYEINLDGALGIILTEVQLLQALKDTANKEVRAILLRLTKKCQISKNIIQLIPKKPFKNILFIHFLLNPQTWNKNIKFEEGQLKDLSIYESWTVEDILKNRSAHYGGVSSDTCLTEILEKAPNDLHQHFCFASSKCRDFMFGNRIDTGYVLTHRLLYLYILRMVGCALNKKWVAKLVRNYCSLILKEARTNSVLGFPQHDIFLEQVVLCGMEGFAEFLREEWTSSIMKWQTAEGCYKENGTSVRKAADHTMESRSANIIAFGCTDHATGLGSAALAVNLRYILQNLVTEN